MRVKKSTVTGPYREPTRGRRKAKKYFRQLADEGIFDGLTMTGNFLEQAHRSSVRHFLEFTSSPESSGSDFISLTSTGHTINSTLNFNGKSGRAPFSTISGICLFGSGTDWLLTESGKRISAVAIGDSHSSMTEMIPEGEIVVEAGSRSPYSYYELEKTIRISRLILEWSRNNLLHHCHSLVIPRIQYYLYFAPAYNLKRVSSDAYMQWIRLVGEKESRIERLFSEVCGPVVQFPSSSLAPIEGYVISQITRGDFLEFNHVLRILSESDGVWSDFLVFGQPQTWKDLINLSYVVTFSSQAMLAAENFRHLIHVDDPLEYVILSEAARLRDCHGISVPLQLR